MQARTGASGKAGDAHRGTIVALAVCLATWSAGWSAAQAASPSLELSSSGELSIDGRPVTCKSTIRTILDGKLPNLGIATRTQLVLNPNLLKQMSPIVRMFVYHHECGHHHVGGDEIGADCWAVRSGVASGWLQARHLGEICTSFGNAKATATHPATAARCRALQKCYADATKPPPATTASVGRALDASALLPHAPAAPHLVREGFASPISPER